MNPAPVHPWSGLSSCYIKTACFVLQAMHVLARTLFNEGFVLRNRVVIQVSMTLKINFLTLYLYYQYVFCNQIVN